MTRTSVTLVLLYVSPVQNLKPFATVVTMIEKLSRICSSLKTHVLSNAQPDIRLILKHINVLNQSTVSINRHLSTYFCLQ
jgi:hypothetical protein